MRTLSAARFTTALLPALVMSTAVHAASPGSNTIQAIRVEEGDRTRVIIEGTREPTFTVFRLGQPPRVVVDLAGADVSHVKAPAENKSERAQVSLVTTTQFKDSAHPIGRVIVALGRDIPFDVKAEGHNVVVTLTAPREEAAPVAQAQKAESPVLTAAAEPAAPASAPGADVVVLEKPAAGPTATKLLGIDTAMHQGAPVLTLRTDGTVERYEVQEVKDPTRLVVDLFGIKSAPKKMPNLKKGPLSRVRLGKHDTHIRVVLDARGDTLPAFDVASTEDGVTVAFSAPAPEAPEVARTEEAAPAARPETVVAQAEKAEAPAAEQAPARSRVEDVKFDEKNGFYRLRITLKGDAEHAVSVDNPRLKVLEIKEADLPRSLERSLDTTAYAGPIAAVATFRDPDQPGVVKIAVDLNKGVEHRVWRKGDSLYWDFRAQDPRPAHDPETLADSTQTRTAGFAVEAATLSQEGVPAQEGSRYSGKKITVDLKDADILNVLRLIADVSKLNIIASEEVKGSVTIKLRNVPWDQALDIILKVKSLGKERNGNIIRVALAATLRAEKEARDAEAARSRVVEPTVVKLLPVNYASATEMLPQVKELLSQRGKATVDQRTNVLIVEDIRENIIQAERLVRTLDTQTPQVLIESRIVEATSNYQRSLGIQWGYTLNMSELNGNPTGLVFPYNVGSAGGADTPQQGTVGDPGTVGPNNYAVNLPATTTDTNRSALGFTFGSIGNILNLNLRLTAAESDGLIKTVSTPKVATLDNKTAKISQGVDIPVARVSAAGVQTQLISSALELEVTPHVTADGSVLMKLKVTNNQPDFGNLVAGIPAFTKKEAATEVMVRDGETTVVGGIYTRSQTENYRRSPFFGSLPVIGWLFKAQDKRDERKELLAFITPRIVNRSSSAPTTTDLGKSR